MVKSKFPGKPSKIIQRSLVRAYSVAVPSCDSSTVSEEVFLGLSVFDQTFGVQDEISSFKGFSSAEIDRSFAKKEEFVNQVREKFAQRGVSLASSSSTKRSQPIASPCSEIAVSQSINETPKTDAEFPPISCQRERRKCGKLWLRNKKGSRYHTKIPVRHNFKALSKNSLIRFKHKSSNYLSDKYCRKFVLPSRSAHSSRVIKPNKRFVDGDKNAKSKLLLKNFKTHKYETDAKSYVTNAVDKPQGSGASVIPSKVIIREARLNITTESAIAGPFSAKKAMSFEKDKFKSGFITCGICGVVRHYKYILQTKKFGIYSCEPCRRFILKMIKQSKQSYCEILKCKAEHGIGKCVIDSGVMCQPRFSNEESPTKSSRCQACWLMLCLQKYLMPSTLRKTLIKLIPEELKIFSTCVVSIDLAKKSFIYEPDNSIYRTKNETEESNESLKKRLRVNHFSKACSSARRLMEKTDPTSTKSRPFLVRKSTSNHKLNVKNKWTGENFSRENNEKELQVPRGPRIKHVCRSASSVLRTTLVSSNDMEDEDTEDRRTSAESEMNNAEYAENEDCKSEKYSSDDKCSSYGDNFESDDCSTKKYGARTLQDFCKESHDKADDKEDKLISIDFWEAYDPDEIFKIGFPLIGTESTNVRALCFLCGSAGQEKLLYCVSCCEAYHWYCAEGPSAFREEAELEKCRVNWVCRKCKVCSTCGERSAEALISCQRCRCSYHPECLTNKALNKRLFNSDRPWVCPSCLKCKSCNISSVFTFVGNVPLCSQCFKLRQKGNYCPLCQGCYEDEDYNVQMMECGVCKCWIHARCEGLSDEKYQILSFLPESIEFVCKLCCPVPPARWWLAVEDELKAGYLGILKKLCKNKQINELFKESPRKNNSCQCEQQHLGAQSPRTCYPEDSQQSSSPNADKPIVEVTKRCLNFVDDTCEASNNDETVQPNADIAVDDVDGDSLDKSTDPKKPLENTTIKQCEICSSANELSNKVNEGLLSVKSNVHNGRYTSLSAFHNDLENAIAQIDEGRLLQTYRETLRTFFPWFDVENASCLNQPDNPALDAQSNDASSGSEFEEHINVSDDEHYEHLRRLMAADDYPYENFRMLDVRICILCKAIGEAAPTDGGRLIYCGRNEWVHSNCALWSSEVFEEIDGSLQNVHSAIARGRRIRCSLCEKKGASIGCCYKNCGLTYHFVCARKAQCKFFHNKTIYCAAHDRPSEDPALSLLANEKDFEILRPVYVEMDRKKKRLECHANVKLRIGSLLVESLGKIDPHLSDHPKRIIPMQLRCTRLFWSTIKPWKIVQYCLQIKVRYSYDCTLAESESNYTIDHSTNEEIVQHVLEELIRKVCAADECRLCEANSVNGHSDLLFPELQDTIYKDLPTDVMNDHTLHDIWNNYDNADSAETFGTVEDNNLDFDTDGERNDIPDSKTSPVVDRKLNCLEKRDSKAMKYRMGECLNGKYLRDKNVLIRDSAKQNYIHNHWFKQLRGRVKRKMNFENSSQSARKRKYENYISPSKLDDALQYFSSYENILQLDGMVEIYNEEEPVKCVQCHRTYRTTISFERHLETCNADFGDFMISSCESDSASSEEEKYSTNIDYVNVTNSENILSGGPSTVDGYNIASQLQDDPFTAKYASNACSATYILDNTEKILPAQSFNGTTNLCTNVAFNGLYPPYTAAPYEDSRFIENGCGGIIQNNAISLQTLLQNSVKQEPVTTMVSSPSIALHTVEPSTMKLNFVSNGNGLVATKACADYITTPQFAFSGASLPTQQYEIQNMTAPAYVIHQSYPKADIIPTYVAVDNSGMNEATAYLSQPATTATIQLQQMPTASVNFQPMMPTILGTIVQPSIVETPTYIVNTAAPPSTVPAQTYAAAAPQSNIILPSQPVIFGLETVVSNTIMSSSQFLTQSPTGNVGASTMYSTTTTQVFQAAKPMPQPDIASSYIVLNPSSSVQSTPTVLHTNVSQPTSVASSTVIPTAKQLNPVVTSCPSDVGTYMYVHVNQSPVPATNGVANASPNKVERKKPPVIMKPVKQSPIQTKKSVKIMKVKNNRPVGIEVKHISASTDIKPTMQLSNFSDEKATKLQIKTTDKPIKLGQPATQTQPVPNYQLTDFGVRPKNGMCHSPCYKSATVSEKSPQIIKTDLKAVPQLTDSTGTVLFKVEPTSKDVNSSNQPAFIVTPKSLPEISQIEIAMEQEDPSSVKPASRSYLEFSSVSNQAESKLAKSEPQQLSKPLIDTPAKFEFKESVSSQLSPSLKPNVVSSSSNKSFQSSAPSAESTVDRRTTGVRTPSETERLFDELMRQHLENEQRRKQRLAEAAAQSSTTTVSGTDSSSPALPPERRVSASMPLLDAEEPYEPKKTQCQTSTEVSTSSSTSTEPSQSTNTPLKFTLLKSKYKPRLQSRISDDVSMPANVVDKKVATPSATATAAAKKLNKSPEKENKEILVGNHDAAGHKNWKTASISFEVNADDGFSYKTNDLLDLWNKILESVQQSRAKYKLPLLPKNASKDAESVYSLLGFENNASKYLVEQLPDAWKCIFYKPVFHKPPGKSSKTPLVENKTGCARSEPFASSHKYDMFGWLTSEHRDPPKFILNLESDIVNGNRRVTSPNLPMTMRFRNLKENAKKTVGVFRSDIHSRGLFCLRDIDAEEMVIEYAGEVIRSTLTDKREKYYTSKGIGCYMFRIDDRYVVDATMCGNAARFINHSCDPNCYSRIVDIHGKKHILIFALKRITKGVELTYDYKFPLEDEKIDCHCKSSKCRKYLN